MEGSPRSTPYSSHYVEQTVRALVVLFLYGLGAQMPTHFFALSIFRRFDRQETHASLPFRDVALLGILERSRTVPVDKSRELQN